jgi:hypothetical protein
LLFGGGGVVVVYFYSGGSVLCAGVFGFYDYNQLVLVPLLNKVAANPSFVSFLHSLYIQ